MIKDISGIWLLVAGKNDRVEIYSAATLRKYQVIITNGRAISAAGARHVCFIGLATKAIQVYNLKTW